MALLTLGLSHHRAGVAVREQLAFTEAELPEALSALRAIDGVRESAILSTCNRTELTLLADPACEPKVLGWWGGRSRVDTDSLRGQIYVHRDHASVLHTLRVASGLDSMVVGEPQILGQVKQAYTISRAAQAIGPVLDRLFQHTFAVAKVVRSRTAIGAHPVSVAYAAVQLARQIFADLSRQTALLVGAGEFMQLLARHLRRQGIGRIIVANRSIEAAQRLASEVSGYAIALSDLAGHLDQADLLVSGTGARGYLIHAEPMRQALRRRRRKPVFLIDLAVPRDIDPELAREDDVFLYTIDDLQRIVTESLRHRDEAARQAEVLVREYAEEFMRWMEARDAARTIRALRNMAAGHRDAALAWARRRLEAGDDPRQVIESVAHRLVNRLIHEPSRSLRHADAVEQALLVSGARRLFGLPPEDEG